MKRQDLILCFAIFFLLLSGVVFYFFRVVIPEDRKRLEDKIRLEIDERAMTKKKVAVVESGDGIPQYTKLTEEILNKKIKMKEIPEKYCAAGAVTDLETIRNKITKREFGQNEQIILEALSAENKWFGDYDRKKEYEVKSIIAGELKAGNIVDLLVSYENGDYDVVVPKTKIIKVVNPFETAEVQSKSSQTQNSPAQPQIVQQPQNRVVPYTIVIAPRNEEEYRNLELAKKAGKLEPRLYVDESQQPSMRTFNYEMQLKKLNLRELSEKLNR